MNPKIQKLKTELEKNTEKIGKLQARNMELKRQIQDLENVDIIGMVRERRLTPEELAALLGKHQMSPNVTETKETEESSSEA